MTCRRSTPTRRDRPPRPLAAGLTRPTRMPAAAILVLLLANAAPAAAQDAVGNQVPSSPTVTWRFAAGQGTLWSRDVASSRILQRVDASPVSWEGRGGAFTAEFDRGSTRRLHHLEGSFEQTGRAVFRTPTAEVPRPAGDGGQRVAGRYEYRRYPFIDLGLRGFDVGLGFQGGAEYGSVTRHFEPAIEVGVRETNLTAGVVAAARLRRWRRIQVEAAWVNGGATVRTSAHHSAAATEAAGDWGVGWLTDIRVRTDVRVSNATAIFVSYFNTGRGRYVSHGSSASGRRLWMVGVSHGR